ncbi:oligosaccharide repeat unit polymerase [Acinetobacter indicus]|uniref:oligosaccharide repeat unit polymerase n=1 Tax=Acinetobacter indicus TaxID=756892 RepID=UPI00209AFEFF|nr:oligosaccharide repeat unit polymerase [Acinetobacter indicus]MCO8102777.1 oligosaccharide repeat unit polymerase [Acinetobacter indicus]
MKKNIKISPFYFIAFLYSLANTLFAFLAIKNNEMLIEFNLYTVEQNFMLVALVFQFISIVILVVFYSLFNKKIFKDSSDHGYNDFVGYVLLLYQLAFMLLALVFGVGVVGQEKVNVNVIILIIFNLLSADTIFFIIGSQLRSNKIFRLNLILYFVSSIIRGWMGGLLIAFLIYLCRKKYLFVNLSTLIYLSVFLILIVFLMPFFIDLKFAIREHKSFEVDFNDYFIRLEIALDYLLGRFQHVGHIYLIMKNAHYYYDLYQLNIIRSFLLEGLPQDITYRRLGGLISQNFSNIVVRNEFGGDWNTNTGLVGWWIVLKESIVFFIAYWGGLILTTYYLIYKYATKQLFLVFSVFMLVYFYHGWLSAFFNLIFLIWILVILKRVKL